MVWKTKIQILRFKRCRIQFLYNYRKLWWILFNLSQGESINLVFHTFWSAQKKVIVIASLTNKKRENTHKINHCFQTYVQNLKRFSQKRISKNTVSACFNNKNSHKPQIKSLERETLASRLRRTGTKFWRERLQVYSDFIVHFTKIYMPNVSWAVA